MSKAVDIFDGILFVRTRHYNDVKKVVVLQGNKPEKRFFEKQRPKGEWICKTKSTFPQYQPDEYKCPFCGHIENRKTKYCCDCGADMRKGGEDNV